MSDFQNLFFSSRTDEWATPQNFFDELNDEFGFTLDVCATAENAKCEAYYTIVQDGLMQSWRTVGCVWCNPPYGKEIGKWVAKAEHESSSCTVVMLIPARTDTRWFHDFIYNRHEVRFIKGRLKFGDGKNSAPFPSMVVIFRPDDKERFGNL